jgi:peptide/nickel transport system substrate-binding protein
MDYESTTRRTWLKSAAAVAGASALAGCGGNGGGGGGEEQYDYNVPEEDVDKTFVTSEFTSLTNINFNPYDALNHPNQSGYYLFNQLSDETKVRQDDGSLTRKHFPNLQKDWTRDGDVYTIEIDDRYTWHNGDPVTADDVAVRFTLDLLADRRTWERAFEDVHVEDEYTLVVELKEDTHDYVVKDFIEATFINTHPDVYSEFLPDDGSRGKAAYEDLASFERTTMKGNLLGMKATVPMGEGTEGEKPVIGHGPFKLKAIDNQRMVFERFDDHPLADQLNFKEVKFEEYTTNQARYQALLGDNFSGLDLTLTQTVWDQLGDHYRKYRYKRKLGHGLAMNYEQFPDHRVRQAIAYAIDKEQVVRNSGLARELQQPHTDDTAVYANDSLKRGYFGEGFIENQLTQYDQDTERATELLEAAGYSLDDGKWYTPEGERFSVTIKVPPTWTEFVNMVQTEVQDLNDFGIDADFKTEELVVYYGQTMIQVDYDMAHWWVGGARAFPWYGYSTVWNARQTIADDHNHPVTYEEVPGPIGEHNGDDTFSVSPVRRDTSRSGGSSPGPTTRCCPSTASTRRRAWPASTSGTGRRRSRTRRSTATSPGVTSSRSTTSRTAR